MGYKVPFEGGDWRERLRWLYKHGRANDIYAMTVHVVPELAEILEVASDTELEHTLESAALTTPDSVLDAYKEQMKRCAALARFYVGQFEWDHATWEHYRQRCAAKRVKPKERGSALTQFSWAAYIYQEAGVITTLGRLPENIKLKFEPDSKRRQERTGRNNIDEWCEALIRMVEEILKHRAVDYEELPDPTDVSLHDLPREVRTPYVELSALRSDTGLTNSSKFNKYGKAILELPIVEDHRAAGNFAYSDRDKAAYALFGCIVNRRMLKLERWAILVGTLNMNLSDGQILQKRPLPENELRRTATLTERAELIRELLGIDDRDLFMAEMAHAYIDFATELGTQRKTPCRDVTLDELIAALARPELPIPEAAVARLFNATEDRIEATSTHALRDVDYRWRTTGASSTERFNTALTDALTSDLFIAHAKTFGGHVSLLAAEYGFQWRELAHMMHRLLLPKSAASVWERMENERHLVVSTDRRRYYQGRALNGLIGALDLTLQRKEPAIARTSTLTPSLK